MSYADRRRYTSHQRDEISAHAHATTAKMKTRMTTKWKNQEIKKNTKIENDFNESNTHHITTKSRALARARTPRSGSYVYRVLISLSKMREDRNEYEKKQHKIKRNEKSLHRMPSETLSDS